MKPAKTLIAWDHDRVLIPGLITSELARENPQAPAPYLADLFAVGSITPDHVDRWRQTTGRQIRRVADLADFLTDCFYEPLGPDGKPLLTKAEVVKAKQRLLRGLSVAQVYETMRKIPLTAGIDEILHWCRQRYDKQIILSDSLDIAVRYQAKRLGMDQGLGVPAVLDVGGGSTMVSKAGEESAEALDARLTGEVLPFDKARCLWRYCRDHRIELSDVALVDDSAANIDALFRPVQEAGGFVVAFNPSTEHEKTLRQEDIPVVPRAHVAALKRVL